LNRGILINNCPSRMMSTFFSYGIAQASVIGFCLLFTTTTSLFGQSVPALERRVSVKAEQRRLKDVFKEIEDRAGIRFSYPTGLFNEQQEVNCHFHQRPVREILRKLLGPGILLKERGSYVILTAIPDHKNRKGKVEGYIEDQSGGALPGVTVFDAASLASSTTNQYGFYEIRIDPLAPPSNLEVRKAQFRDTSFTLPVSGSLVSTLNMKQDTTWHKRWVMKRDSLVTRFGRLADKLYLTRPEIQNVSDTLVRPFQISLVPYVGTNRRLCGHVINQTSFNLIGGYARGVNGFEVGGLANLIRDDVRGAQISGALNLVGGSISGVAVSGLATIAGGRVDGVLVNGGVGLALQGGEGVSVAGLVSMSKGKWTGLQLSGLANTTIGDYSGTQLAGLLNVGSRNVTGTQVSGFFNYARRMNGLQLGVFNYCDTTSGVSVGFLSFVNKGYHPIELSVLDNGMLEFSWRTGLRKYYTFISGGWNPWTGSSTTPWSFGYGLGTSPRISEQFYLNVELSAHQLSSGRFSESLNLDTRLGLFVEYALSRRFAVFGGPCYHGFIDRSTTADLRTEAGASSRPFSEDQIGSLRLTTWIGWRAGVRFF